MTDHPEDSQEYVKTGILQSRIRDRERQAALGRGLGALLQTRSASHEGAESPGQPLPELDLNQVARPFAGSQPRALLERIQGLRKSGSGQGLQALLDAYGPTGSPASTTASNGRGAVEEGDGRIALHGSLYPVAREHTAVMMDLALIHPNPFVPLSRIDKSGLDRLCDSIREHGFLRPLVIMPSTLGNVIGAQTFWLISGERSWQAARIMGMRTVPVRVLEVAPREALQMILVDEWHSQRLPTMDRARLCGVLHDQMGMSTEEMAERLAVPYQQVTQTLRYLALDPDIQDSLNSEQISEKAAQALIEVPSHTLRLELWRYAVRYKWNAARIERAVKARMKDEPAA